MSARFSPGPWRVVRASRTRAHLLQIKNHHADPIAVVYTTAADASLMAASPRLLASLKAVVKAFPGDPRTPTQARALNAALALLIELTA